MLLIFSNGCERVTRGEIRAAQVHPLPGSGETPVAPGFVDGKKTVTLKGERIAVVRKNGALCAISNVCPHQNGPLGEGVVRDGYLECPWHGYQFDPCTGLGPPGFSDSVPRYDLITKGNQTYLRAP